MRTILTYVKIDNFVFLKSFELGCPEMVRGEGGKQEFRSTDFGSRLLAAEGKGGGGRGQVLVRDVSEVTQYPSGSS